MSVPENARTKSKLEVNVKAHELCCYTLQITANKKIFTENYQRSLTDRIVAVAIGINVIVGMQTTSMSNAPKIITKGEGFRKKRHGSVISC